MGIVGDAWETPPHLDRSRQLAGLVEGGADRGGIRFGHDEHPGSMRLAHRGWQGRRMVQKAVTFADRAQVAADVIHAGQFAGSDSDARPAASILWLMPSGFQTNGKTKLQDAGSRLGHMCHMQLVSIMANVAYWTFRKRSGTEMARKPKPSRPTEASATAAEPELPMLDEAPAPVRRGRPPKSAKAPLPSFAAADDSVAATDVAGADEAGADARDTPSKRRQGRKPKPLPGATAAPLSRDEPRRVKRQQGRKPDDAEPAAEPEDAVWPAEGGNEGGMPAGSDAGRRDVAEGQAADEAATPAAVSGSTTSSRPAAQWDRATDTVQFDWPEIERTASQDGPNQAMAKLLVAARAEGARSRWPL